MGEDDQTSDAPEPQPAVVSADTTNLTAKPEPVADAPTGGVAPATPPAADPPGGSGGSGGSGQVINSLSERAQTVGVSILSVLLALVFAYVVYETLQQLNQAPVYLKDGTTVSYDPFVRAKDILTIILPLFTTIIAFWVGQRGAATAQKKANDAKDEANAAKVQVALQQGQLVQIQKNFPQAFGPW